MATKAKRKTVSKPLHTKRYPGESVAYRTARNRLLRAEIDLRKRIESIAAMRRSLPAGGPVKEDYVFEEVAADTGEVRQVKMSDLFARGDASLVVYSFMYSPAMAKACPSCTSIIDSLDGAAPHAAQRINLVVVAKSPIGRIRAFAKDRGWRNVRLLSSGGNTYNHDYHAETETGSQLPAINVFAKHGRKIHHTFASELLYVPAEKGQDGRHVDMIWPLWNLLDYTPEGRGADWRPKLAYPA